MTRPVRPPGHTGTRRLVLTHRDVDIDRYRRLGDVEIVIVRRRADGTYDEGVGAGFDAASTDADSDDVEAVREAVRFATRRLDGDPVVELTSVLGDPPAAAHALERALPGTVVWVAGLIGRAGTVLKIRTLRPPDEAGPND